MVAGSGTMIGYARVSTFDQNAALQEDALTAAGCGRIFADSISGYRFDRPELANTLDYLGSGYTLVVWRLDRPGRSLKELIKLVGELDERGVGFRSLNESIDTTTSGGRLIFHVFAALAEFERELLRERTQAGLAAARARGRTGGRPSVMTAAKTEVAKRFLDERDRSCRATQSVSSAAEALGVSRSSVYRALERDATRTESQ